MASACNCSQINRPALEHALECPARVEFFGGDVSWDRSKLHLDGKVKWEFDTIMGAWRPYQRYYIHYQIVFTKQPTAVKASGTIWTNFEGQVNINEMLAELTRLKFKPIIPGPESNWKTVEAANAGSTYVCSANLTEDPDTGLPVPGVPLLGVYLE